jgi:hypothetical protein
MELLEFVCEVIDATPSGGVGAGAIVLVGMLELLLVAVTNGVSIIAADGVRGAMALAPLMNCHWQLAVPLALAAGIAIAFPETMTVSVPLTLVLVAASSIAGNFHSYTQSVVLDA